MEPPKNPKTTFTGYGAVVMAIAYVGYRIYEGQAVSVEDFMAIGTALAGVGLINSRDGSH